MNTNLTSCNTSLKILLFMSFEVITKTLLEKGTRLSCT